MTQFLELQSDQAEPWLHTPLAMAHLGPHIEEYPWVSQPPCLVRQR